jgi:hypothetical protein
MKYDLLRLINYFDSHYSLTYFIRRLPDVEFIESHNIELEDESIYRIIGVFRCKYSNKFFVLDEVHDCDDPPIYEALEFRRYADFVVLPEEYGFKEIHVYRDGSIKQVEEEGE